MAHSDPVFSERAHPIGVGETAPDFTLPAVNREAHVSLSDYRGRCALLLVLFRGLHCPFCRQQIAQLSVSLDRLRTAGLEVVGVIDTPVDRARLYLRHRPTPLLLLSDPQFTTHRAYGLPKLAVTLPARGGEDSLGAEGPQLVGYFVIDRDAVVRWAHVEGDEYAARASKFPDPHQLLDVAATLPRPQETRS